MKSSMNVEFPCGLKYAISYQSGLFEWFADIDFRTPQECPLHGKECSHNPYFGKKKI